MSTEESQRLLASNPGNGEELLGGTVSDHPLDIFRGGLVSASEDLHKRRECRDVYRRMWQDLAKTEAAIRIDAAMMEGSSALSLRKTEIEDKTIGALTASYYNTPRSEVHQRLMGDTYANEIATVKEELAQIRAMFLPTIASLHQRAGGSW